MPPVAAADAHKSSSSTSTSSTNSSSSSPKMSQNSNGEITKLCHIVKRADFDGYGFNLHSEKSKPGQYIGKIDENSPAEAAGLIEGDRIIEVNGLPIGNETHKQVVQRIKAIAWEVKLLVAREPRSEKKNDEKNSTKNSTTTTPTPAPAPPTPPTATNNGSAAKNAASAMNNNITSTANSNGSGNGSVNNQQSSSINQAMQQTSTSMTPPSPPSVVIASADANANQKPVTGTLKLPSTAAEMRAILQSKKKYNPKSDDVNLQKKYEIIQKL